MIDVGQRTVAILGLSLGLLLGPSCGKSSMSSPGPDAELGDGPGDLPGADVAPIVPADANQTTPDLRPAPDLATPDVYEAPDLLSTPDLPKDVFIPLGPPDVRAREVPPVDLSPVDLGAPPDLSRAVDLLPARDVLINLDQRPGFDLNSSPDELIRPDLAPPPPDGAANLDSGSASELCTKSGGTVDTASCCTSVSDFRDTCTTAVGACGCSPASSRAVSVCTCPNSGCYLPGVGCVGPAATCTIGMDQTCNDNLMISSVHGKCVEGGRCLCTSYALVSSSGKCL